MKVLDLFSQALQGRKIEHQKIPGKIGRILGIEEIFPIYDYDETISIKLLISYKNKFQEIKEKTITVHLDNYLEVT